MHPSRRSGLISAAAAAALMLAGCASMNVSSYVERGMDPARYRTFDWGPAGQLATGDPRLDSNPFFQQRVQAAVEKQLAAKGFEKTPATPDLLLHYHASVTQRVDVSGDRQYGDCENCGATVYEAGTLVIDLVDARTNKLVWRGWAESSLDGVVNNQAWLEERIDKAVAKIVERLPRAL